MSLSSPPKIKEKQKTHPSEFSFGFLKDKKHLDTLKNASVLLFGKSGILTEGTPKLVETVSLDSALSSSVDLEDAPAILQAAGLSSDGEIRNNNDNFEIKGRPIEKAILEECLESGVHALQLYARGYHLLDRLPFGGNFVGALYEEPSWPNRLYVSGSPETLLDNANYIYRKGQKVKKSALWQEALKETMEDKMRRGFSVIGVSYREVAWRKIEARENHLSDSVFLGFLAFKDLLRQEVVAHIARLKNGGVKTIFATGENAIAAHAILQNAGLLSGSAQIINGTDFQYLNDREIFAALKRQTVFGRLNSAHKLRISQVLQDNGEVVAYIGSETNDVAPILSANVGVAILSSNAAAREAADIIVTDDRLPALLADFGLMLK